MQHDNGRFVATLFVPHALLVHQDSNGFWDNDVWVMPALLFSWPQLAKTGLRCVLPGTGARVCMYHMHAHMCSRSCVFGVTFNRNSFDAWQAHTNPKTQSRPAHTQIDGKTPTCLLRCAFPTHARVCCVRVRSYRWNLRDAAAKHATNSQRSGLWFVRAVCLFVGVCVRACVCVYQYTYLTQGGNACMPLCRRTTH